MKSLQKFLEYEMTQPLGFDQLKPMIYRKNLRNIDYEHIKKSDTLKTLLPKPNSGLLILFSDKRKKNSGIGHFVLLFKHSRHKQIHFFDPLGIGLRAISRFTGNRNVLLDILKHHDVVQNSTPYQKREHDVQICGRHCVTRYNMSPMNSDEYFEFMKFRGCDPDMIVTLLTLSPDLAHWETLLKKR